MYLDSGHGLSGEKGGIEVMNLKPKVVSTASHALNFPEMHYSTENQKLLQLTTGINSPEMEKCLVICIPHILPRHTSSQLPHEKSAKDVHPSV